METTAGREDEEVEDRAREETVPPSELVLEEVVQERAMASTPRERGKMYYYTRGVTSEYSRCHCMLRGTNESRIDLDCFVPEFYRWYFRYLAHIFFRS